MGSFINHKSNISALESKFQSIGQQIAATINADDDQDVTTTTAASSLSAVSPKSRRHQEAHSFLDQQQSRVTRVERDLLQLTYEVFPSQDDTHTGMSMKELSRAIYQLQHCYLQRLADIQNLIDESPQSQQEQDDETQENAKTPVPQHWTLGRQLTAVTETDHETDSSVVNSGKSAASSNFFKSPTHSASRLPSPWASSHKRRNGTPYPIKERDEQDDEFAEQPQQQPTPQQPSMFYPLVDDDDETLTLLLSPPTPNKPRFSSTTQSILSSHQNDMSKSVPSSAEKRVNTFAELDQKFRRAIFNDSGEANTSNSKEMVTTNEQSNEEEEEEYDDEEETVETMTPTVVNIHSRSYDGEDDTFDDSALYCATVVQSKTPRSIPRTRLGPRPSQVEFDPRAPASPAMSSVNLTTDCDLDETVADLNKAMAGLEPVQEASHDEEEMSSQFSTETPVLDRYRLDVDEKAPGGLIVRPNPRRSHRKVKLPASAKQQRKSFEPPLVAAYKSTIIDENAPLNLATGHPTFHRPTATSSRPSDPPRQPLVARQSPSYAQSSASRRTSYQDPSTMPQNGSTAPSPRLQQGVELDWSRQLPSQASSTRKRPPHLDTSHISSDSDVVSPASQRLVHPSVEEQLSSPNHLAARPATEGTRRPRSHQSLNGERTQKLQSPSNGSNRRATFHTPRMPSPVANDWSPSHSLGIHRQERIQIRPITQEEYDASGRFVTMQVTLPQMHQAVVLLNQSWRDDPKLTSILTENQIKRIWSAGGINDKQRKRILLSLCHWRRLVRQPAEDGSPYKSVYHVVVPSP